VNLVAVSAWRKVSSGQARGPCCFSLHLDRLSSRVKDVIRSGPSPEFDPTKLTEGCHRHRHRHHPLLCLFIPLCLHYPSPRDGCFLPTFPPSHSQFPGTQRPHVVQGEIIEITSETNAGWWTRKVIGRTGLPVPPALTNFNDASFLANLPPPPPICKIRSQEDASRIPGGAHCDRQPVVEYHGTS
jgi:hypothetical protein